MKIIIVNNDLYFLINLPFQGFLSLLIFLIRRSLLDNSVSYIEKLISLKEN